MKKWVLSIVILSSLAILVLPYYWGIRLQQAQQSLLMNIPPSWIVVKKSYQRHWWQSKQDIILRSKNSPTPTWQLIQQMQHGIWQSHIQSQLTYLPEQQILQATTRVSPLGQQTTVTIEQWSIQQALLPWQLSNAVITWETSWRHKHQVQMDIEHLQVNHHQLNALKWQSTWDKQRLTADIKAQQWQHPMAQGRDLQWHTTGKMQSDGWLLAHDFQSQWQQLFPTPSQLQGQWQQQFLSIAHMQIQDQALLLAHMLNGHLTLDIKTKTGDLQLHIQKKFTPQQSFTTIPDFKLTSQLSRTLLQAWQQQTQHRVTQGLRYLIAQHYLLAKDQSYQLQAQAHQGRLEINQHPALLVEQDVIVD